MYKINRKGHYAMIHKGVNALLKERMGYTDDDEYRNYLAMTIGKTSCKEMSDEELVQVVINLRNEGYLDHPKRPGGSNSDRPTSAQWAKLAALSKERGWKALEDDRLDAFVERTTGLKKTRWLTGTKISEVILGLERWLAGGRSHG
ncbi:regulatory protein GemA [Vibrio sp. OPT18]|uniref:regulatory protein GemA n=1 Tax=Vibrio sp. OPT18 TaxID=2778641 RepID=UPI0018807043|nr:regulatory protein GemA [Vibrio sp. OPT18]MBE8578628.1 regulatory protein GemA [Vibrio sp. OPT18]